MAEKRGNIFVKFFDVAFRVDTDTLFDHTIGTDLVLISTPGLHGNQSLVTNANPKTKEVQIYRTAASASATYVIMEYRRLTPTEEESPSIK